MEDIKDIEVGELQTEPLTVPHNYNISKIVGVFNENEVYEVFIIEKDKVGTITIRDVLKVSHLATAKTSSLIKFPTKLSLSKPAGSFGNAFGDDQGIEHIDMPAPVRRK